MSPTFCTTDIPFEVMGPNMQNHATRFNPSTKSRRILVEGMRALQLLIANPLLRWYVKHGSEVTKIYQTMEYNTQKCFRYIVCDVSDAQRQGDVDPSKSILADTRKLQGKSACGPTIMNQELFQDVKYVRGERKAQLSVQKIMK